MVKTPATARSWKTNPLPSARKLFELDLVLSAEEYQQAQLGHVPDGMDDKWFIYFEDGWLNLHRSWTGNCIYRLRFEPSGSEYRIIEAWVNLSPAEYKSTDDAYEQELVRFLIDAILLDKPVYPPRHREAQT